MKRSERLYAITEYLRRRRAPVTVADLARRFEVDARTIHRDLASLREQHVPVQGEPGRGGGLQLHRDFAMPPLALTIDEAVSLWVTARVAQLLGTASRGRTLASAIDKVLGAMPVLRRRELLAVLERIIIASPAAPGLISESAVSGVGLHRTCEQAFIEGHALTLDYRDRTGARTERTVEPHGLLVTPPLTYLLAYDRLREAPRSFRMDRILGATRLPRERFEPRDPRRMFSEIEAYRLEVRE